jgi:hypothetical protein
VRHRRPAGPQPAGCLKTIFRTAFTRATRLSALIEPSNTRSLQQAVRLGFVYEGFIRLGIEGVRDAYMFGMLAGDCRWLAAGARPAAITKTDVGEPLHGF